MSEQTARDLVTEWHAPKYVREHLIAKITVALAQARREEREACAELVEVMELGSPSGRSAHEQRNLFEVMDKIASAIRQREGA